MTRHAARSSPVRPANRFLRLVLRLDQAGSAAFIAVALVVAPALGLLAGSHAALLLVGVLFIAYAVALAALGVWMAFGLSRLLLRGEQLPDQTWVSVLMYRPVAVRPPHGGAAAE
jgi:hypothetical protein